MFLIKNRNALKKHLSLSIALVHVTDGLVFPVQTKYLRSRCVKWRMKTPSLNNEWETLKPLSHLVCGWCSTTCLKDGHIG